MPNTVLKIPEMPDAKETRRIGPAQLLKLARARLRVILLVVVPLTAAAIGSVLYLNGGRYITTDNAYVGAQKVLITPDISGKIDCIFVKEGQHVAAGDQLFEIDPVPFQIALSKAQGKLASVRTDFATLKTNLQSLTRLADLAQQTVEVKQRDVERKNSLVARSVGTQADLDSSIAALVAAQLQAQQTTQQKNDTLNQLLSNPDLPIEQFPAYIEAKAELDQAERDLNHTMLRAPIAGNATQVDSIQLGRFVTAGTPVFSVVDDSAPWVDANPKETDITYLRVGQHVTMDVDSFPDQTFRGTVAAVSPGTGAQFAILPPQNASGNWVKIVQRVPVRIAFDRDEDTSMLRSGMSVYVSVDTRRSRSFASLLGLTSVASEAHP